MRSVSFSWCFPLGRSCSILARLTVRLALAESLDAALGFVDALEAAYDHICRAQATGSPRYAHELNLPGLRFWPCKRSPYLIFYMERADGVEVWRVLHGKRDIPHWIQDAEPSPR